MSVDRSQKRDLWERVGAGPHPCYWCAAPVGWAEVAQLPAGVLELRVGQLEGELVPACPTCWERECGPRLHPRDVPPAVAFPRQWGPRRLVLREVPRRRAAPQGTHVWCFILECGHRVSRRSPNRTFCYCEICKRRGPRVLISRRRVERTTVIVGR